ncbi:MAG: PDDEXK nuclease domain-containing protein [Coleofasciculus sp. B1-GNL1-01]|uniref:PDDEXK nuclease domain-containing protein n=1 Tax=Coleofasciculus sp. B1-GNL1-01 TaxID=3068484 RepID=UPI0032FBA9DC
MSEIEPVTTEELFAEVKALIDAAKQRVAGTVNAELTLLYWHIGHRIYTQILKCDRATYGKQIISTLAQQLTQTYGKGWSVRQLQERIDSMLYERTALSRKPEDTIRHDLDQLRKTRQISPDLLLKDPYILDFLQLNDRYLEKDLEDAILRDIEQFLLELGAGFTFVARQKKLQIDDDEFYLDLLFYNRKLKRLIAIDLKLGSFKAEYKGQMELYLRWLAKYEQEPDENPPLGIILCAGKKQEQIELLEVDKSGIHVAEYLTVLPPKAVLQTKLQQAITDARKRFAAAHPTSAEDNPQ